MISKKTAIISAALVMVIAISGVAVFAQTVEAAKEHTMVSIDGKAVYKEGNETITVPASFSITVGKEKVFKKGYLLNATGGTLTIGGDQYQIVNESLVIGKELEHMAAKLVVEGPDGFEFTFKFLGGIVYHANGHGYYVIKGILSNADNSTKIGSSFLMQASR